MKKADWLKVVLCSAIVSVIVSVLVFLAIFPAVRQLPGEPKEEPKEEKGTLDLYVRAEPAKNGVKIVLHFPDIKKKNITPTTGKGIVKEGYFKEEENGMIGVYFPGTQGKRFASIAPGDFARYRGCPFIFVQNTLFREKDIAAASGLIEEMVVIRNEPLDVPGTLLIVIPKKNIYFMPDSYPDNDETRKTILLKKVGSQPE